ncbi:hypothetical protein QR680_016412 [Steinernema hermaphroditum]|uniref:Uncharacterized protein n=1 Tax=Steinernema hermaphroditum TaxID=289476 RepID=A0AA39HB53_9BILA|nr:hypothetical protein QR680_016412 [Steinernema hermaphroditum]
MGLLLLPYCPKNCVGNEVVQQPVAKDNAIYAEFFLIALALSIGVLYLCYIMFLMFQQAKDKKSCDIHYNDKSCEVTFV